MVRILTTMQNIKEIISMVTEFQVNGNIIF
jgi:hypothetical protein